MTGYIVQEEHALLYFYQFVYSDYLLSRILSLVISIS